MSSNQLENYHLKNEVNKMKCIQDELEKAKYNIQLINEIDIEREERDEFIAFIQQFNKRIDEIILKQNTED